MLDLWISGAKVLDGTGKPAFFASVGVKDGTIVKIDRCRDPQEDTVRCSGRKEEQRTEAVRCDSGNGDKQESAVRCIDGTGLCLCPGFIDFHSHGDLVLGTEFAKLCKVSQGITTEIGGQCGSSLFPVNPDRLAEHQALLSVGAADFPPEMKEWTSFSRYLNHAQKTPLATHMKLLIGHGSLRLAVMGFRPDKPSKKEMDQMKGLLREAMEMGAMGLSSGLIYTPSAYGSPEELTELVRELVPFDGYYTTHMRNESDGVEQSVEEALEVARQTGVRLVISHHKICGKQNWGRSQRTLELIDQAVSDGVRVTLDQYPYTASMTHLNACIPPWYFTEGIGAMAEQLKKPEVRRRLRQEIEDPDTPFDNYSLNCGGFEGVFISACPVTHEAEGLFVPEYANRMGKEPFEAFCDLMVKNRGEGIGIYHCMWEDDLCRIIQNPNTVVGTDGICRAMEETAHPRAFGSFVRAICHFHKEKKLFSLEEMIRKLTSLPASRAGLTSKGLIREGWDADLVLFDYDRLEDQADFMHSNRLCQGISQVIVNGRVAYEHQKLTGENPGQILLHSKKER